MRRTFWITAGAVLGVVGYRRLDRTVKSLTGQFAVAPPVRQTAGGQPLTSPGRKDQPSSAAAALSAVIWTAKRLRSARGSSQAIGAQVGGFLSEVRTGMAEYLEDHERDSNRQHSASGSTLVGQARIGQARMGPARGRLAIPGGSAGASGPGSERFRVEGNRTHDIKDGR